MIKTLIHTSKNNNLYIYNHQFRLSMLIHPEFIKAHEKSTDTDPYYLKKYEYLENHDFFSNIKSIKFGTLDESMVKETIAQTPQITFEVTDFCNLNCSYCSFGELYEGFEARNFKNINTVYAINLLKYFLNLRSKNKKKSLVIGFYGGEPLLNVSFIKQIVEVVNLLNSDKKMDIKFNMTTNATLLHKHFKFIVENKFDLMISLDGNKKNHSYRFFRKNKKESFRNVIENVDMIQRYYPEYFVEHVSFNAVLHDRNSVKDIYEFIFTRYHKIPRISEMSSTNKNMDKKDLHSCMFNSKVSSEYDYQKEESNLFELVHNQSVLYKELVNFIKYYSVNFYISNITALLQNEEKKLSTNTCLPGHVKIFLNTRNKLLPCERLDYKYSIGEVNENIMMDIPEITRRYNYYYEHINKTCQDCYVNRYCGVCLFHLKNIDKVNTEKFVCEEFYDYEGFKNKLYRIFSFLEEYPNDFSQIIENVIIE